jgi:lysozyme
LTAQPHNQADQHRRNRRIQRLLPRLSRRALLVLGLLLLAGGGLLFWRFYDPGWRYEVKGVDVSHHQGEIDWVALADDNVSFAYIKSTEGSDWVDSRFAENWQAAGETGITRGAYHFFTLCTSGAAQAGHMVSIVPTEPGTLPPAIDLEFAGNCSARPTVDEFRDELDAFLTVLTDHYETKPVIYTNAEFYREYLSTDPPDVTWWIQTPLLEPWGEPEWTIWQHTQGRKDGVDGDIDRNVFRGDSADLVALVGGE